MRSEAQCPAVPPASDSGAYASAPPEILTAVVVSSILVARAGTRAPPPHPHTSVSLTLGPTYQWATTVSRTGTITVTRRPERRSAQAKPPARQLCQRRRKSGAHHSPPLSAATLLSTAAPLSLFSPPLPPPPPLRAIAIAAAVHRPLRPDAHRPLRPAATAAESGGALLRRRVAVHRHGASVTALAPVPSAPLWSFLRPRSLPRAAAELPERFLWRLRGLHAMALEAKQAALCIKKVLRFPIRKGYRFVSEHPILFGFGVLLYLLYRSSPGFFAFLLSSSPVIICTTLLLGALLSYGEINLPEASEDHKGTSEISAFKVENPCSDTHFEANQRLSVPGFREDTSNFKEREINQTVSFRERASEHVPLLRRADEEDERGDYHNIPRTLTPFPSMVNLRQESGIKEDLNFNKRREPEGSFFIQNKADRQTILFDAAHLSGLNDKETSFGLFPSSENVNKHVDMEDNLNQERVTESSASKEREISEEKQTEELAGTSKSAFISIQPWEKMDRLNVDTNNAVEDSLLDSSLGSPWARVGSQDGSSGFDSDGAESSSPDASMTDIAPVLDEIDPLLGADSARPDPIPKDDSDTDSHVSEDHQIDDDSNDEGDENDSKDNAEGKKKDDGKDAAFLWTADDEKNLMDLGYSEMERNRRLEILMARRRSRKNIRFEIDNNFIDVDSNGAGRSLDDLSRFRSQVAPIAVPRRNPFDLPYDFEEAAIPGSAPSILHARKNPFDLPLEQPHDIGDSTHDNLNAGESVTSPRRDMFFRRHESFNFGRTDAIQERRFSKLKPYFVPETVEWNASNFQRQFSDKSDSKLSSVTESDVASSVADQEDHKDHDEKHLHMEHESPALVRQDSDLADAGSECSDGINSIDVELDNSDIDERETALHHFVFERSQEREAHLASTKGKGHEEDYSPKSSGNSKMPFHPVPDLLSWEDGDGDSSPGSKPSFELNAEAKCSEWVLSSRPAVEGESHSRDHPEYLHTDVASSSNTVVLGASNIAEKDGNVDFMSYADNDMPLDNLIQGSMELPSEFVTETLPVISRDLHPIPEERVLENFSVQENHEAAIFTDSAGSLTGLHVIEEHFDLGSGRSLSSVSSYSQANDAIQSPLSEHAEVLNPFISMAAEPNKVEIGDMNDETTAGYLLDSDDEAGKIYPEPMEDSGIDESFLSELDTVGDFGLQPMRFDQQVPDQGSQDVNSTSVVAVDSVISPQTSDNVSLTMSEASAEDSREQSPVVDDLNGPEFSWSLEASHGDPEQTVYNPRSRILEASPFEAMNLDLKPPHIESEVSSDDAPSTAILAAGSSELEVTPNELVTTTTNSEMTILDAKSLEDIETAFKLVSDGVVSEPTMDTEHLHISGVNNVDSEPKEGGELHVIDAKSVNDIHVALKEHCDSVVNRCLEENEDKAEYGETSESTKHDEVTEAIHFESSHDVRDAREDLPVESTSNKVSNEAKTHDDIDAVFSTVSDVSSAKSSVQGVEQEDSHKRGEEREYQ
ncbi:hypothetical protein HU200_012161 [Digitaria exilis]|uniref:Uncharacterized protein n=1 Tax=Digitaria exilis TaxID=1010633 RepID=A0A835KKP5_9POAL|nr:hypothetical protein HU200_012161 [Digitaria exilis]